MKCSNLFLFFTLVFLASCDRNRAGEPALIPEIIKDTARMNETSLATGDNSSNSLDWAGTYKGTVPCADCEGIEKNLVLHTDLSYSLTTKYLGKKGKNLFEDKGQFIWNKEGNIITLNNDQSTPNKYLVGENKLIQLDLKGERITGQLAEHYFLKKIN